MSADIEIVTHCYSEVIPFYAEALRWQMASMVTFRPMCHVRHTVVCTASDHTTLTAVDDYQKIMPDNVIIDKLVLPKPRLFRRCIGRNIRAKGTGARVLWFTDADYFFGPNCLDTVAKIMDPTSGLSRPRTVKTNTSHTVGDAMMIREHGKPLPQFFDYEFAELLSYAATGGIQLIGRDTCHAKGYLDGTTWVLPVDPKLGFFIPTDDIKFRQSMGTRGKKLDIPNCYRIRHTVIPDWGTDRAGPKRIKDELLEHRMQIAANGV